MKCRLCDSRQANHSSYLVWTQMVWLVVCASAEYRYYHCPCCDECAAKARALKLRRAFCVGGFIVATLLSAVVAGLLFFAIGEPMMGALAGAAAFSLLLSGGYSWMTRWIHPATAELIQDQATYEHFLKRRGNAKWTLFNGVTVVDAPPTRVRIREIYTTSAQ